jgi:glucosyl-dolichyl phosphate glucuronosyltransferase
MTTACVAIAAHTFDRLDQIKDAVASVLGGDRQPDQVVVVVDNNPRLAGALTGILPSSVTVLENEGRGLSHARNRALNYTNCDIVAFLDDDATASPSWLHEIVTPFDQRPEVVGVGGRICPNYDVGARPVPAELLWLVGSTYQGHRETPGYISRPIGANMAFRRHVLTDIGGFDPDFGVVGTKRVNSNEEIALCSQLRGTYGEDCIWYAPTAVVDHFVPAVRTRWRYVIRRSWVEGRSKAGISARFGQQTMADDRSYASGVLLPGLFRYIKTGLFRRDRVAVHNATALVVVALATAGGYVLAEAQRMVGSVGSL